MADELQRQGIGTALAQRIVAQARGNGFARLTATTLWENRPARSLLRRLGFCARASRGHEIELELRLSERGVNPQTENNTVVTQSRSRT